MQRALALMLVLSACGTEEAFEASSVEEAVVLEPPVDAVDLLGCIDIPESPTLAWIRDRLVYNRTCFDSWSVSVAISECPIGDRVVSGEIRVAGEAMAALPPTGVLIRARAAAAALTDLVALESGDVSPHVDVTADGDGLSLAACGAPAPGGLHADLSLYFESKILGAVSIEGAADLTRVEGVGSVDFLASVSAAPPGGPALLGELTGVGLERSEEGPPDLCPDAGEVRFAGSIDGEATEVLVSWIGGDQVVITLPDGESVGPMIPRRCAP